MKRLILLVLVTCGVLQSQIKQIQGFEGKYSVAYWEPWATQVPFDSVARGPWNVVLMASNYVNTTTGALNDDASYTPSFFTSSVSKAHAQNVKILYTIIVNPETEVRKVIKDPLKKPHITAICNKLATYNFDGIDLDWEGGLGGETVTNGRTFLKDLRDSLDARFGAGTKWITLYAPASSAAGTGGAQLLASPVYNYINLASIQGYDYYGDWSGTSGYNGPLYSTPQATLNNDANVTMYLNQGIPASKIAVMSRWNGLRYRGGNVTGAGQPLNGAAIDNDIRFFTIAGAYNTANAVFDNAAKQEYLSGGSGSSSYFVSWDGPKTIAAKIAYAKARNLGGYAGWTVQGMYVNGRWAAQVPAMWAAFRGDSVGGGQVPSGTFTATPNSLPVGGGSTTLSWTSVNATSASIDQGVGTVQVNGLQVVNVSATTIYTLTLTNTSGQIQYPVTVTVATPPPSPPSTPVLASPVNGATGVATSPTLSWNSSSGATSYRVQVATDAAFASTVVDQSDISATSYVPPVVLTMNTTYYWHVNATNSGGTSSYSPVWNFTTTATAVGPIAAYSFDEGTGTTVTDASGHGFVGTVSGATWTTAGKYNKALSFNGSTNYIDFGNPALLQMSGSMTLSAWVKASADPVDDGQIVSRSGDYSGWQLKTSPDTGPHTFAIAVSINGTSLATRHSTTVRALNTWYYVTGVYNASTQTLDIYVNGILDNGVLRGVVPSSQYTTSLNVNAGRRPAGYYFNGVIDEVRIYNRALIQPEILSDMISPLGVQAPPATPSFIYPVNGATGVPSPFTALWSRSNGATNYHVQISPDSLFGSATVNDSTLTDTLRQVSGLASATKFWRRVRAKGAGVWSGFGTSSSFITASSASAPTVTTGTATIVTQTTATFNGTVSANGASTAVRFVWGTVSGIYTDSAFAAQSPVSGSSVPVSFGATGFNAGTVYYFRVRAYNSQSAVQGSERTFTTLLPSGQGPQDITAQGSPIALITNPTGGGNHNIEVIRDGNTPPVGSTNGLEQYDTYTGGGPRSFDWIGYQFASTRSFTKIVYQEGLDGQLGGCFLAPRVQVRSGGVWIDVQNLVSDPPYAGSNLVNYEAYELSFALISGDAIRIAGVPTGSAQYIGVAELRIFELLTLPAAPVLTSPSNGATRCSVSPTLKWTRPAGAVSFHLQVSTDSLFSWTFLNDSTLTNVSRRVNSLAYLTKYFWRVRAQNALGAGQFSSTGNFITKKNRTNVTSSASIVSLVTQPVGHGNPNVEVIRDSVEPDEGGLNPLEQYATFTGSTKQFDWIGYTFPSVHRFSNLSFQEGVESDSGGWFASLNVQVRVSGVWVNVQNLSTNPPYVPNNGMSFESYELNFDPVVADGVRLAGTPGGLFTYVSVAELVSLDDDSALVSVGTLGQAPAAYTLDQNYPNPFNPTTKISFNLPVGSEVTLTIFNILGQEVATLARGYLGPGRHTVDFAADRLPNGVYLYSLKADRFADMKKMVLLK